MKQKLLVVSHSGVLDVNRALFRELAALDCCEVVLIVPAEWKGDLIRTLRYAPSAADAKIRVIALPVALSGRGSLYFFKRSLRRVLGDWSPDVVFVFQEPWSLAALQAFASFPRARRLFFTAENLPKWIPWPFSWSEQWIYRKAAGAFTPSNEADGVVIGKGYRGALRRLYYSYDARLFYPRSEAERAATRVRLGLPVGVPVLAYFGRLVPEKGVLDIPKALAEILRTRGDLPWVFLCVGNGPMGEPLRELLSALPADRSLMITAVPHDQVAEIMASIDVLLLPSRSTRRWKEQFGRVLVEAMACRAAVVGSDSGEIPHLIQKSGAGGVFREGDVLDFAAKIREMLETPALLEARRESGAAFAREQVSHQAVARGFAADLGVL